MSVDFNGIQFLSASVLIKQSANFLMALVASLKEKKDKISCSHICTIGHAPSMFDKGWVFDLNLELDQSSYISLSISLDWKQRHRRCSFCSPELRDLVNLVPWKLLECRVYIEIVEKTDSQLREKRNSMYI